MSKKSHQEESSEDVRSSAKKTYKDNLRKLQVELVSRLHYTDKDKQLIRPDRQVVFAYDTSNLQNGQLAK